MATLKVNTTQDKAAFVNHLKKQGIELGSQDIENIPSDGDKQGYFLVKNLDDDTLAKIKDALKGHKEIDISTLKEMLRRIVREELSK
jgi:hypothetical protein